MNFKLLELSEPEMVYLLSYFLAGYSILVTCIVLCRPWNLQRVKIKRMYASLAALHISLVVATDCSPEGCVTVLPYMLILLVIAWFIHFFLLYRLVQIGEVDAELLVLSSVTVVTFMVWVNMLLAQQFVWVLLAWIFSSWILVSYLIRSNRLNIKRTTNLE